MLWTRLRHGAVACALTLASTLVGAVDLDTSNPDSIRNASKLIATDMMAYYTGNLPGQTPGYLPGNGQPGGYFWWIGGGMFATMVDYWYYTGDETWANITSQAIYFQSDPSSGGFFDSPNISIQLGNDDQAFWAFAALDAAEYVFQNPPDDYPSWIAMAQGVFNQQVQRWDTQFCGGGLRWQAVLTNAGYNYKNSISNGAFFQLAARLAKYTGNTTYIDWAVKTWNWSVQAGLINIEQDYTVIDGIYIDTCTTDNDSGGSESQWSYNVGVYMYGAAALWNITQTLPDYSNQTAMWEDHTNGLLQRSQVFFQQVNNTTDPSSKVLTEVICENTDVCSIDASTFKAYTGRWLRATALVAPFTTQNITTMMADSPDAAAASCNAAGMNGGAMCGQEWYLNPPTYDGRNGIGEQMNALQVIFTLLPAFGPVSHVQGKSKPNPNAGSEPISNPNPFLDGGPSGSSDVIHVTSADRGGAWFVFALLTILTFGGALWILKEEGFEVSLPKFKKKETSS